MIISSSYTGKTESILFGTKEKLLRINTLKACCNGTEIVSQKRVLYLGIDLDFI